MARKTKVPTTGLAIDVPTRLTDVLAAYAREWGMDEQAALEGIVVRALERVDELGIRAHELQNGPGLSCRRCGTRGKGRLAVTPCV